MIDFIAQLFLLKRLLDNVFYVIKVKGLPDLVISPDFKGIYR